MARPAAHVRVPGYCRHAARNTAYVRLDGKIHYLPGPYGSAQSRAEYMRLISQWTMNGRSLPNDTFLAPSAAIAASTLPSCQQPTVANGVAVAEVIEAFLTEAERQYPPRDGRRNCELILIESALSSMIQLFGHSNIATFKPVHLETVLNDYVTRGFCRNTANRYLSYCKRFFKWAVKHEYVSGEVFYRLLTVNGLRKGRSAAKDHPKVVPADEEIVDATLPYLSDEVAAMVRLQILTGMRGGEVVQMRRCNIDQTSGKVWRYVPQRHKTQHHGISRKIPLGPKAQEIIKPFLTMNLSDFLFSPKRAEAKRRAKQHAQRKTPMSCGNVPGSNRKENSKRPPIRDHYDSSSYGHAIARACKKAFPFPKALLPDTNTKHWTAQDRTKYIAKHGQDAYDTHHAKVLAWYEKYRWHPHRLRHNAGTRVARDFGEVAAQNLLGHTNLKTTLIYVERNWNQAAEVMAQAG